MAIPVATLVRWGPPDEITALRKYVLVNVGFVAEERYPEEVYKDLEHDGIEYVRGVSTCSIPTRCSEGLHYPHAPAVAVLDEDEGYISIMLDDRWKWWRDKLAAEGEDENE